MSSAVSYFACIALTVLGLVSSVPVQQQQQQEAGPLSGGLTTVMWSVWDDCFGGEDEDVRSPMMCIKSKALSAVDRALSKPTLTIADGVSLTARAGKALQLDQLQSDKADRAALDAATDPDQKSALLDDMLASRVDRFVSTRTIVMDAPVVGQEGRGKKKDKAMKQAMMMMGMMMAAIMGPMMIKIIMVIAIKALVISKIALVLSLIMVIKKLMMMQQSQGGGSSHESDHHESYSSYGRSMQIDAHNLAYSGQNQS